MGPSADISAAPEWRALADHRDEMAPVHLRELFAADPGRADRFTASVGDLVVDWSRQRVTDRTMELLVALARRAGVAERMEAMVGGAPVNVSEGRAALHTALRAEPGPAAAERSGGIVTPAAAERSDGGADGTGTPNEGRVAERPDGGAAADGIATPNERPDEGIAGQVQRELRRMADLADEIRSGRRLGASGRPITAVVNLGIGGSDLGPRMACEALAAYGHDRIRCRFASNLDGSDLATALSGLDPAETLFMVASKSFATVETLANAATARAWIAAALGEGAVADHFAAATAAPEAAVAFGIDPDAVLRLWDWVGGRFSLCSAAAAVLMIAIGPERFSEMLAGFRAVDEHLAGQPAAANLPMLLGLVAVWNRNFWGFGTRAVLPYSSRLRLLPAYLQQLDMESNGKQVCLDGSPAGCQTGPVVWGGAGADGQHSFHQWLHQGADIAPADFIVFAEPDGDLAARSGLDSSSLDRHHDLLAANCLAQAEALAFGSRARGTTSDSGTGADDAEGGGAEGGGTGADAGADGRSDRHGRCAGNRPSTVILAPRLTPSVLGQIAALYEHQVAVQGAVWGINSFDQPGVELGKQLAGPIAAELSSPDPPTLGHDAATNALIRRYRRLRNRPC